MESRKSKKTRSHAEASWSSRDVRSSLSPPVVISRPQLKDRVKSAPLVAQTGKARQEKLSKHISTSAGAATRVKQESVSSPVTSDPPPSPIFRPEERTSQSLSASGQVGVHFLRARRFRSDESPRTIDRKCY